jgi:DNA segregation ATPase FtsK/SpoIIIE-like protein
LDDLGKKLRIEISDILFKDAAMFIVGSQLASVSLLERRLKLGYDSADSLMDRFE